MRVFSVFLKIKKIMKWLKRNLPESEVQKNLILII